MNLAARGLLENLPSEKLVMAVTGLSAYWFSDLSWIYSWRNFNSSHMEFLISESLHQDENTLQSIPALVRFCLSTFRLSNSVWTGWVDGTSPTTTGPIVLEAWSPSPFERFNNSVNQTQRGQNGAINIADTCSTLVFPEASGSSRWPLGLFLVFPTSCCDQLYSFHLKFYFFQVSEVYN